MHAIETPPATPGPVAIIRISATDLESHAQTLGFRIPRIGGVSLVPLFGIDHAVAARPDGRTLMVTPHGGIRIVRRLSERLEAIGFPREVDRSPREVYPEAHSEMEASMLAALAASPSPRAVDILLAQPARWGASADDTGTADPRLDRLLSPPTVVVLGRPNIGKSSLLNALASERVALDADHEGTTRDHVGVTLTLDGLGVHWIDAPGIPDDPGALDRAEFEVLGPVIERADLIVLAADASDAPESLDALPIGVPAHAPRIRLGLRADAAGGVEGGGFDAVCSAKTGAGVHGVARMIRAALVPDSALADPRPWRFWGAGAARPLDR